MYKLNDQSINNEKEKDGGTNNISIYKDYWFGIQGLVSAH